MKKVIGLIVWVLWIGSSIAAEYRISSATDLRTLELKAGDRVIMENGTWKDQQLLFQGQGTAQAPITLTVDSPGSVILTGSSSLTIEGMWLVVDGLSFRDGYTLKENVISFSESAENCRLTNTSIVDYNNPDKSVRNSWIVLYGKRNRIDHCYIEGKTHVGTTIGVYVSDEPNYHRIDHNYFAGRPPLGRNGGEIIRMGTDQWSMHDSYTTVEENIFVGCDGEIEIISNKSTNNIIRNNLFFESKGMLTLRHGNKAIVYGNYFIGNHKEGTGGIRIIGEDHKIFDNYMHGLTGEGLEAAITFMNAWENPPLHGYWQVKNTVVERNTIIDCREPIVIGSGKNEKTFIPPANTLIANNLIKTVSPAIVWTEPTARHPKSVRFKNNIVQGSPREDYPPGMIVAEYPLAKNRFGIYETMASGHPNVGMKAISELHEALLQGKEIGPNWMNLERDFKAREPNQENYEVKVIRNVRYAERPGAVYASDTSSDRLLDMYLPVDDRGNPKPVYLFIHGGGFAGGDKSALDYFWRSIATQGFVVLSVNYRLYLKHHKTAGASASANMSKGLRENGLFHPELQKAVVTATEDVTEVLAWIRSHAQEYGMDTDRVAVSGGSAGGMTALHLAYGSGQQVLPIAAVVNLWGGMQDTAIVRPGAPPLLTFHGDQDKTIHVDYGRAMNQRLSELGIPTEYHELQGQGHAIYKLIAAEYVDTIVSFLRRRM